MIFKKIISDAETQISGLEDYEAFLRRQTATYHTNKILILWCIALINSRKKPFVNTHWKIVWVESFSTSEFSQENLFSVFRKRRIYAVQHSNIGLDVELARELEFITYNAFGKKREPYVRIFFRLCQNTCLNGIDCV